MLMTPNIDAIRNETPKPQSEGGGYKYSFDSMMEISMRPWLNTKPYKFRLFNGNQILEYLNN